MVRDAAFVDRAATTPGAHDGEPSRYQSLAFAFAVRRDVRQACFESTQIGVWDQFNDETFHKGKSTVPRGQEHEPRTGANIALTT